MVKKINNNWNYTSNLSNINKLVKSINIQKKDNKKLLVIILLVVSMIIFMNCNKKSNHKCELIHKPYCQKKKDDAYKCNLNLLDLNLGDCSQYTNYIGYALCVAYQITISILEEIFPDLPEIPNITEEIINKLYEVKGKQLGMSAEDYRINLCALVNLWIFFYSFSITKLTQFSKNRWSENNIEIQSGKPNNGVYFKAPSNEALWVLTAPLPVKGFPVVRPNYNTLYVSIFVNTSEGPVYLSMPEITPIPQDFYDSNSNEECRERLWLLQCLDAWTNATDYRGTQYNDDNNWAQGRKDNIYKIIGPSCDDECCKDVDPKLIINLGTDTGWVLIRILSLYGSNEDKVVINNLQRKIKAYTLYNDEKKQNIKKYFLNNPWNIIRGENICDSSLINIIDRSSCGNVNKTPGNNDPDKCTPDDIASNLCSNKYFEACINTMWGTGDFVGAGQNYPLKEMIDTNLNDNKQLLEFLNIDPYNLSKKSRWTVEDLPSNAYKVLMDSVTPNKLGKTRDIINSIGNLLLIIREFEFACELYYQGTIYSSTIFGGYNNNGVYETQLLSAILAKLGFGANGIYYAAYPSIIKARPRLEIRTFETECKSLKDLIPGRLSSSRKRIYKLTFQVGEYPPVYLDPCGRKVGFWAITCYDGQGTQDAIGPDDDTDKSAWDEKQIYQYGSAQCNPPDETEANSIWFIPNNTTKEDFDQTNQDLKKKGEEEILIENCLPYPAGGIGGSVQITVRIYYPDNGNNKEKCLVGESPLGKETSGIGTYTLPTLVDIGEISTAGVQPNKYEFDLEKSQVYSSRLPDVEAAASTEDGEDVKIGPYYKMCIDGTVITTLTIDDDDIFSFNQIGDGQYGGALPFICFSEPRPDISDGGNPFQFAKIIDEEGNISWVTDSDQDYKKSIRAMVKDDDNGYSIYVTQMNAPWAKDNNETFPALPKDDGGNITFADNAQFAIFYFSGPSNN